MEAKLTLKCDDVKVFQPTLVAAMEEQHQPATKTIRFKEMDIEEEDRISELQDCLLIEIISRLPTTKEAIRTGALSKRWQHLWPYVHNLIFSFYMDSYNPRHQRLSEYVSFVEKTLTQCPHLNLNKFQLRIPYYDISFESQVNKCVRYAVSCNVQHLDLCLDSKIRDFERKFVLDQFFFFNSCFSHLKLGGCVIIPTGAISWTRLTNLYISTASLDEDLIQNILSGCPLLETLELFQCSGYRRLDITSKSIKRLVFSQFVLCFNEIIEINAPYVLSLTIEHTSFTGKLLLLDVSSVVEAKLDYWKNGKFEAREERDEMFKGFILKLRNVKELTIGHYCQREWGNRNQRHTKCLVDGHGFDKTWLGGCVSLNPVPGFRQHLILKSQNQ